MESLNFLSEVGKLKDVPRTGWIIYGVTNPESVSDHSFRMALMAMAYARTLNLDENKCIKMSLLHDIHEIYCGDIATRADESNQSMTNEEKRNAEKEAFEKLMKLRVNNGEEMRQIWEEYNTKETAEAKFVSDLDKIEMVLQALDYKNMKRTKMDLEEFFQTSGPALKTEKGKELWNKIRNDYLKP